METANSSKLQHMERWSYCSYHMDDKGVSWNVECTWLLFVPVIINPLGIFFHRPKNASASMLSKFPVWQLYSEGFYYVLVKAGIYVILGPVLCFDSVLLPCLTDISPVSGLPPEPGQCGGVSRVRGQPSWSTTKKEKQEELWSDWCWQILAKTQRKVNIYCW